MSAWGKNSGKFNGHDTGYDMWRDYKARYGVVAAYCICRRYLKMQAHTKDISERDFCYQLKTAMATERNMTDIAVYKHSSEYAKLDGSIDQYTKSDKTNRLCAGDIDAAIKACSYGDGSVDYKDALTALMVRYGIERLRFVLACEVNYDSVFGCYPKEIYTWASEMNIHENYGRYGVRTRPEFLVGLIAELRQAEQTQGGLLMKNKHDFYIAFYEQLALQGFQAYVAYDKKIHIADICVNGYNIIHLTNADYIEPNPYAEGVETATVDKVREIMRDTALAWGICTEKPYNEGTHKQLPDGSYRLAEFEGTVLACKYHSILGYVFSTFKEPPTAEQSNAVENFYNKSDAMQSFAVRSGLIDERLLFSEKEMTAIYSTAINAIINPVNEFDSTETKLLETVVNKIECIMPYLADNPLPENHAYEKDTELEGVEQ